jgi:predicted nucleic acid-binding protein
MILADTSVWIEHFRKTSPPLQSILEQGLVLLHPAVFGELACGNLTRRDQVLQFLAAMPQAKSATHAELITLIHAHKLWEIGMGWIDAQLLASCLLTPCRFWTLDKRLRTAAAKSGVALFEP